MICYICREEVIIPTELTGFNCYKHNEIHCNSFHRICLYCAINFLQLNRNNYERDLFKKCLICSELCNLFTLNFHNSFKIDFLQLKMDDNEYNCQFCNNYTNTSIKLLQHLNNECPDFIYQCHCGTIVPKKSETNNHLMTCPHYNYCILCSEFIEKTSYEQHQNNVHLQYKCLYCYNYFPNLMEHSIHCPLKIVVCFYCNESVKQSELETHYINHENTLQQEVDEMKENIKNLYIQYYTIQRERIKRFNNFYLTN